MRPKTLAAAIALLLICSAGWAQDPIPRASASGTPATLRTLTLDQALALIETANPALRIKQAELAAAEGVQADAAALFDSNPDLSTSQTRRETPQPGAGTQSLREWGAGVSQRVEIAGQRGYRRAAAGAAITALRAEIADTRLRVRAEATERFYRVLALQQRIEIETQALKLFDETAAAIQKRREAGEDTRLDANVASVEAERARNQLAIARERLLDARSDLAATLQLAPATLPQAAGDLAPVAGNYRLADLLSAADAQPRLRALVERENSADARLKLERARRYPDITVGASVGTEAALSGRDRLTTFSVSVPLPLYKRNQLGIGLAATELNQVQIARQATQRDVRASVTALWIRLESLDARVRRLQESVLPALDDNQTLSLKSKRAGQIGLLELIVVNRQALDARRDLIDALTEYHATRVALELAAGWPQQGTHQ